MSGTLLDTGKHADVWLSTDGTTVRKVYRATVGSAADLNAAKELATLARVAQVLRDIPGVSSPAPFTSNGTSGMIEMEFRSGKPLHQALSHGEFAEDQRLTEIAGRLARALVALTEELPRDQLDLSGRRNVLYDNTTDEIVLLDFTPHEPLTLPIREVTPLEQVVGSFLAAILTVPLHRATILKTRSAIRMLRFAKEVMRAASAASRIDQNRVRDVAWRYYWHRTSGAGRLRYAWFSTVGWLLYGLAIRRVCQEPEIGKHGHSRTD